MSHMINTRNSWRASAITTDSNRKGSSLLKNIERRERKRRKEKGEERKKVASEAPKVGPGRRGRGPPVRDP